MNKKQSNNNSGCKRKARNRPKNKKWKRTRYSTSRIFQEVSFDSNDENDGSTILQTPSKPSSVSLMHEFNQVVNLTPSKSESDSINVSELPEAESSEILVSDDEHEVSCILAENTVECSSDEEVSYSCDSIIEEFVCGEESNNDVEIFSADINGLNDTENMQEVKYSVVPKEKRKFKQKNSIVNNSFEESEPVQKKPKENFLSNSEITENLLKTNVQCHFTSDGIVVVLDKSDTVYIHGLCLLSVLHGQIEVLGHTLTKNSPEAKLYSLRGSSLLYLKNVTDSDIPVNNYLLSFQVSNRAKLTDSCAVVLCKKLQDPDILFIEKYMSQQLLPKEYPHLPRVVFQPKEGSWNVLKVNEKWTDIIDGVAEDTKLMICGGRGVGKTTFLRFAINRLLMKFDEVRIIDLDPGQSEFTVPGCISIVKVNKPIFGANYTHLHKTERSIVSNINIAYEPDKYIASVRHLVDLNMDKIPTLINYMGYSHGIGMNILSAVIVSIQPSDVLQICSQDSRKNYIFMLEVDVVIEHAKLFVPLSMELNYNLHQIESMCDRNGAWTAAPRQLREMCTLAYISQMGASSSFFKSKAPVYKIRLEDVVISDTKGENLHPAAINATLVALCALVNGEEHAFQCFGWGIVRGIDLVSKELVLITAEKLEVLDKVTHLVSGGATLPPSVYMTPDDVIGAIPYVMEASLISFGQIPKRSIRSIKSVKRM